MRPIEPVNKIGEDPSTPRATAVPQQTGGASPTAIPVVDYGKDTSSLSETAAIVNRMRAQVASEGGIRPHVVAQLKHDLSQRRSEKNAEIERAIARLLQVL